MDIRTTMGGTIHIDDDRARHALAFDLVGECSVHSERVSYYGQTHSEAAQLARMLHVGHYVVRTGDGLIACPVIY